MRIFSPSGEPTTRAVTCDLRRELEGAVAAEHQHLRMEGLALVRRQAVDEQPLAFLDAVLLAAE